MTTDELTAEFMDSFWYFMQLIAIIGLVGAVFAVVMVRFFNEDRRREWLARRAARRHEKERIDPTDPGPDHTTKRNTP